MVRARAEQLLAGVTSGGEVGDGLVHEFLVDEPEPFAGHRPCLARRFPIKSCVLNLSMNLISDVVSSLEK